MRDQLTYIYVDEREMMIEKWMGVSWSARSVRQRDDVHATTAWAVLCAFNSGSPAIMARVLPPAAGEERANLLELLLDKKKLNTRA